jgi:uncharacterized membrane protein YhaH (DUF805 family)
MFQLCYVAVYFVATIVDSLIYPGENLGIVTVIFWLATVVPAISITCRRLHDTGRSGWWQTIGAVPLVGWIVLLVFLVQGSSEKGSYTEDIEPGQPTSFGLRNE